MSRVLDAIESKWRLVLMLCVITVAGSSVLGRVDQADEGQIDEQTSQQECRSDIDGALGVQVARSLLRIERSLAAIDKGESYSDVVKESEAITKPGGPFEVAIQDRLDAVAICKEK